MTECAEFGSMTAMRMTAAVRAREVSPVERPPHGAQQGEGFAKKFWRCRARVSAEIGIAGPWPVARSIAKTTPTTGPASATSGPPELPSNTTFVSLTTPVDSPNGEPLTSSTTRPPENVSSPPSG